MRSKIEKLTDKAIGKRIRERRELLGFSQARVAKKLNITFQQLQKYEKGDDRVAASRLVEIAAALGISAYTLLGEVPGKDIPLPEDSSIGVFVRGFSELSGKRRAIILQLIDELR